MDNRRTILYRVSGAKGEHPAKRQPLNGLRCEAGEAKKPAGKSAGRAEPAKRRLRARSGGRWGREKPLSDETHVPVPQTDTGGQVEYTKAFGKTLVKELGKIAA